MQDTILVFSRCRDQAGLVARTLRCREVFCLPVAFDLRRDEVLALAPRGLIVITDDYSPEALEGFDLELLSCGLPVLALGGAAALMCAHFGGEAAAAACERSAVTLGLRDDLLFEEISGGERMLHGLATLTLPDVLLPIATATEQVIGYRHESLPLYAMQYPIERNDPDAAQMLYNFALSICGATPSWDEDVIIDRAVELIRQSAPEGRVLCAVSGGVDSAVCAKLTSLAVGDRLKCVFIDTGLFRKREPQTVIETFRESLGIEVELVDASETFLRALGGMNRPQDKERIALQMMSQMLIKQCAADADVRTVVLGTNFNDTFLMPPTAPEMAAGDRTVGVCEPIRSLFKDEVRRLATVLSLPASITGRQPFPSSGLALRVMSSVSAERLHLLRQADAIFREEITSGGHDRRLWQYYATLIESPDAPDSYAVCLRATQAAQGGALAARLPDDVLEYAAERIRSEVKGVTRVVYDLTPSVHYGELE